MKEKIIDQNIMLQITKILKNTNKIRVKVKFGKSIRLNINKNPKTNSSNKDNNNEQTIIEVTLSEKPVKNKANEQLISIFKNLGFKAKIVHGMKSRDKTLEIEPMQKNQNNKKEK